MSNKIFSYAATAVQTMFTFVPFREQTNMINPHNGQLLEKITRIPITITPQFVAPSIHRSLVNSGFYDKD